jgi:hypothetical protein
MLLRRHAKNKNLTKLEDLDTSAESKKQAPKKKPAPKKQAPKKAGE